MSIHDIEGLIKYPNEERWIEFKHSTPWTNRRFRTRIVKTIIGMSNIRNGGWIIIGKEDDGTPTGMPQDHYDTYSQDNVRTVVDNYADPQARIDVISRQINGLNFVIIRIHEFDEMPVICKRQYRNILRQGALYTRSTGRPETIEVPSQTEMREIINMAKVKAVRLWVEEMSEIGIPVVQAEDVDERYREQIGDLR